MGLGGEKSSIVREQCRKRRGLACVENRRSPLSGCRLLVVRMLFSYFRPNLLYMEKLVFISFSAFAEE